jgi:hypothetical protein
MKDQFGSLFGPVLILALMYRLIQQHDDFIGDLFFYRP